MVELASTRSSPQRCLLGVPDKHFLGSGLPKNGAILRNFIFHYQNRLTVGEATKATIVAALVIRENARIPAQCVDSGVRKLWKLYEHRFVLIQGVTV